MRLRCVIEQILLCIAHFYLPLVLLSCPMCSENGSTIALPLSLFRLDHPPYPYLVRSTHIPLPPSRVHPAFPWFPKAGVSIDGVRDLLRIFGDERYMLAFTPGVASKMYTGSSNDSSKKSRVIKRARAIKKGIASVILHRDATGADTVKSLLALEYFHDELAKAGFAVVGARTQPRQGQTKNNSKNNEQNRQAQKTTRSSTTTSTGDDTGAAMPLTGSLPVVNGDKSQPPPPLVAVAVNGDSPVKEIPQNGAGVNARWGPGAAKEVEVRAQAGRQELSQAQLLRCLEAARRRADEGAPGFFAALAALGWSTEKFMFGNIKSRVEWRL